jgi:hypothetical protein
MNDTGNIINKQLPFTFNPYKHHLDFLKNEIEAWRNKEWIKVEQEIKCIGNNLVDLYYGKLTVAEIIDEFNAFKEKNELTSAQKLELWLKPLDYKKVKLSDGSLWVVKQGQDESRFLHIHPGKYSPFTLRAKAPTLKTVIALKVFGYKSSLPGLSEVNKIRTEKLKLSPVKALVEGKGIARLFSEFS